MFKIDFAQCQTFWQLIVRSFVIYRPNFKDKAINALIWTLLNVTVVGFIMPTVGLYNFGPFILITTAASNSFFTANNQIPSLVSEINGDSSNLQYELTLPIPQRAGIIAALTFYQYNIFTEYRILQFFSKNIKFNQSKTSIH